jgi:hypothetical protein
MTSTILTQYNINDNTRRVIAFTDPRGVDWLEVQNGKVEWFELTGDAQEVEWTLRGQGWQVTPSVSMRGIFRATPKPQVLAQIETLDYTATMLADGTVRYEDKEAQ